MPDTGPGRPLKFPYSLGAKFLQFPFKVYWKKGRGFRYFAYAVLVSLIIVRPIDKFVNGPANVALWNEIRSHYKHDKFAPPVEGGGRHH